MALLEVVDLKKTFIDPEGISHPVIDIPHFLLEAGQKCALAGASGCGKTTFLHLITGILKPDSGQVSINGTNITQLDESQRDRFRAMHLGYIFQSVNLIQGFTCLENVLLGMAFGQGIDRQWALHLLDRVGLSNRLHHYPRQLSIGQQQRVAVARALASKPKIVVADEPTGSLDVRIAKEAIGLIRSACEESGAALLLVSHDPSVLAEFSPVYQFSELRRAPQLS